MLEKFRTLFSVQWEHNYFANNQFKQFNIIPAPATAVKMQRMEMLYRIRENKLIVLINENSYATALTGNIRYLNFYVYLNDPYFYNYTNGDWANIQSAYFFFSNIVAAVTNNDKLHANEFANETNLRIWTSKNVQAKKPFAVISIYVDKDIQPVYRILFDAMPVFWAYLLVSKHLLELEQPFVLEKDNNISFETAQQISLPDYRKAIYIKSLQPIRLQERYKQNFALMNKNTDSDIAKTIIHRLPYPDIEKISNVIKVLEKDLYKKTSEIYL